MRENSYFPCSVATLFRIFHKGKIKHFQDAVSSPSVGPTCYVPVWLLTQTLQGIKLWSSTHWKNGHINFRKKISGNTDNRFRWRQTCCARTHRSHNCFKHLCPYILMHCIFSAGPDITTLKKHRYLITLKHRIYWVIPQRSISVVKIKFT